MWTELAHFFKCFPLDPFIYIEYFIMIYVCHHKIPVPVCAKDAWDVWSLFCYRLLSGDISQHQKVGMRQNIREQCWVTPPLQLHVLTKFPFSRK